MTPEVTLRLAGADDLPQIVQLLADDPLGALREAATEPLPGEYAAAFTEITAQTGNCVIVATEGPSIVGCLQLTFVPGLSRRGARRAFIEGVRVSTAQRGRGIGNLLIQDAIDRARAAGCALVQLTTDVSRTDAHRFYERLGFVASHLGYKLALKD